MKKPLLPYPKKRVALLEGRAYTEFKRDLWENRAKYHCETCNRFLQRLDQDGKFDVFSCAHLSHIIPRRRGGDVPENVLIECYHCHFQSDKGHWKWRSDKRADIK